MNKSRKNSIYFLFFCFVLLLVGCSNDITPKDENYIAKVSDFEENIFTSSKNQSIGLFEGSLKIKGIYDKEAKRKSSLDEIIASISAETGNDQVEKTFSNAEIKTENDKYFITADEGINLVFTKVGERIIKDEEGMEFSSPKYSN